MKLGIQTLGTFLLGAIVLGILLFLPAWTFNYWQAWVFIVVFGVATNAIGGKLRIRVKSYHKAICYIAERGDAHQASLMGEG